MYKVEIGEFETIWGNKVKIAYRPDTNDGAVIASIMNHDEYVTKSFTYEDGDVFIDIGAHIGVWSTLMASLNPSFQVYSYEPIPENFALIRKTIRENGFDNIHPFELAISDESGGQETVFYTNDDTWFGAQHKFIGSMLGGAGIEFHPDRISINDIFLRNGIERCKVLKTDCEGCEILGFATITPETLQKIEYIVGEFHTWKGVDYKAFYGIAEPYFDDISHTAFDDDPTWNLRRFLWKRK